MLSKLMTGVGAFLMALCGGYLGRQAGGELSLLAMAGFAIGVIWMAQAPAVALRKRVEELERRLGAVPANGGTSNLTAVPDGGA